MIEVSNIVTLENGEEYLLIEKIEKENKKYFYSVRTLENDELTDEFIIFEAIIDETGEYLQVVEDKALYDSLLEEFKDVLADRILNTDFSDLEIVENA